MGVKQLFDAHTTLRARHEQTEEKKEKSVAKRRGGSSASWEARRTWAFSAGRQAKGEERQASQLPQTNEWARAGSRPTPDCTHREQTPDTHKQASGPEREERERDSTTAPLYRRTISGSGVPLGLSGLWHRMPFARTSVWLILTDIQ